MKIYTKKGDQGTTSLLGGKRVSKDDLRIEAYGTVDELNSWVGMLRDQEVNSSRNDLLVKIQEELFTIGSHLALEEKTSKFPMPTVNVQMIQELEQEMDKIDAALPPLTNFVLPGGHQSISYGQIARTVCRRAERRVIALHQQDAIDEVIIQFINRLSDYLFMLTRVMARELNAPEAIWKPRA